ncbi:cellulase family glycosylhydrolase [Oscillochloris sp. ZM17-4]|uniref:cellulase family glycosylhydrolase n=1 Tax=Oscillochloris sp. ZM17-4 TaxID=2866714 RepID=UPI001C72E013|nr:cellulase family glycosylhydrolase [Oscillochloris sp. ZM17-4]MBX0329299.1 cellulase family glycosylhydrolase [Oscillochloris sp. ZM17-4]
MPTTHLRVFRGARLYLALVALLCAINVIPAAAKEVITVTPDAPPLPAITIADGRLVAGDQPFEIRGANYVRLTGSSAICSDIHFGADGRCPWDQAAIDADMDRMQALGVNTVRVFLNYYVFGGAGAADPAYNINTPLEHLDRLIASANRRGIYVLPVLMAKYPQDRFTEDGLSQAIRLHITPLAWHLASRTGVLAWDLFNEPDIGSPVDERCWDWDNGDFPPCKELAIQRADFLTRIHWHLRTIDPTHLTTIGMGFAKSYFRPAEAAERLAGMVDFYSFHYYDNDPYDSGRYAQHWYYGQGFPADLQRGIDELATMAQAKPVLISELGFPTGPGALRDEAALRHDLALGLRTSRERGAAGVILWPFQPTPEELIGDLFTAP